MKKIFTIALTLLLSVQLSFAQTAPDFTFTDTHGDTHNLQNALDQGFIVLIDFFFVDCPPCQATAPEIQSIHEDYDGKNVIVWSISDRDANSYISTFKENAGLTYIAGGSEGGGGDVVNTYAANFAFSGFPTFSVVCPDGSITWDIWPLSAGATNLRDAIEACGVEDHDGYVPMGATAVDQLTAIQGATLSPNPVASVSRLSFNLATATDLTLSLFNAQGVEVAQVFDGKLQAGTHTQNVDMTGLPAGAYWLRMQNAKGEVSTMAVQKF